ncbi:hypothetical protein [Gordonia aurantiaca]|uniref:hypothetical protein n=1 Tax=Gordonia sp. B21 TaxID=3151852 RepID=UPI003267BFA8
MGGALAWGPILGEEPSGSESPAGVPTTVLTLGAAAAGLPLASRRGRRPALTTGLPIAGAGALIVAFGVHLSSFPLMSAPAAVSGCVSPQQISPRRTRAAGTSPWWCG